MTPRIEEVLTLVYVLIVNEYVSIIETWIRDTGIPGHDVKLESLFIADKNDNKIICIPDAPLKAFLTDGWKSIHHIKEAYINPSSTGTQKLPHFLIKTVAFPSVFRRPQADVSNRQAGLTASPEH